MKTYTSHYVEQETRKLGVAFLGKIPFDNRIEKSLGKPNELLKTVFAERIEALVAEI
jgi:hypothetical protein